MNNFWNNIARSTVRELARAAGLRSSNEQAVEDLTSRYGPLPTEQFVDEMWLVLRDGWLTRSAPHREAVVARMRELGRGDMSKKVRTRSEQLAYLRTLRRSPSLAEEVLKVFLESGSQERQPPVFVQEPSDAGEQQDLFFVMVRRHLLGLDATTIDSFERTVYDAIHTAVAGLTLPVADPNEAASRIASTVASVFMLADRIEPSAAGQQKYQELILERLASRVPDAAAAQRLFGVYVASLVPVLKNPKAGQGYVADWASAVFMATLGFDAEDAPPGFLKDVIVAQRRFLADTGPDKGSGSSTKDRRSFDEALNDAMGRIPNCAGPTTFEDGALCWWVYMGSAAVSVLRAPFADRHPPLIQFLSPLVRGVELSDDLHTTLNLMNARELFYRFYWKDGTVVMTYELEVDSIDEPLFLRSLSRFAAAADHFDTMFRDRFGGLMTDDDQQAVFDA